MHSSQAYNSISDLQNNSNNIGDPMKVKDINSFNLTSGGDGINEISDRLPDGNFLLLLIVKVHNKIKCRVYGESQLITFKSSDCLL